MSIGQAEEVCWRLGTAERRVSIKARDHIKQDPVDFLKACDLGLSMLREGEPVIDRMLDRLFLGVGNRSGGPANAYGPLYLWLTNKRILQLAHLDHLRSIVEAHALREIPFVLNDSLFGKPVNDNLYISVRAAATTTNLQYASFVRRAREHSLLTDRDLELRRFPRSSIRIFKELNSLRKTVTKEYVTELFGISGTSVLNLVRDGLLPTLEDLPKMGKGFRMEQFDRIMEQVGMNRRPSKMLDEHVRFDDASISRVRALRALLDGSLHSQGPTVPGDPKSLLLLRKDVESERVGLRDKFRRPPSSAPPVIPDLKSSNGTDFLTLNEFSQRLGLRLSLARDVLATGLIECQEFGKNKTRRISIQSVEDFISTYFLSDRLYKNYSVYWGDRIRTEVTSAGMTVIRLAKHPTKDLLRFDELPRYLPLMLKRRNDWHCDYRRDRSRRIAEQRSGQSS